MDNETRTSWVAAATAAVLAWGGCRMKRSKARKTDAEANVIKDESVLRQMQTVLDEMRTDNRLLRREVASLRIEIKALHKQNTEQAQEMERLRMNHLDCDGAYKRLKAEVDELKARG